MKHTNQLLGWREWVSFPDLDLPKIKAKIDTGARTSSLHAFEVVSFQKGKQEWVRFSVHPHQKNDIDIVICEAPLHDKRIVTDSGGHAEERFVIQSSIIIGSWQEKIEINLTARDNMKFRVLIGRTAMKVGNFIVNPSLSYQQKIRKKGTV